MVREKFLAIGVGIIIASFAMFQVGPASAAPAVDVAIGPYMGCSLHEDGAVYCWGKFPDDALGQPPYTAKRIEDLPPAISIAVGRLGACAVDRDGIAWCWGVNYQQSVKANSPIASLKPFRVEGLPPVKSLALGYVHWCALSKEGDVWCWGENPCGELGCGDKKSKAVPVKVELPNRVVSISAGVNNTCAVLETGIVSCWGSDNPTMPGRPFVYESDKPGFLDPLRVGLFKQVANGRNFACGITLKNKVTCWGSNIMGQIGTDKPRISGGPAGIGEVENIKEAIDIDASYFWACAVDEGKVVCWGNPGYREPISGVIPPTTVSDIEKATRVGVGLPGACAVANGSVRCWGLEHTSLQDTPIIEGMRPDHPVLVPGLPAQ